MPLSSSTISKSDPDAANLQTSISSGVNTREVANGKGVRTVILDLDDSEGEEEDQNHDHDLDLDHDTDQPLRKRQKTSSTGSSKRELCTNCENCQIRKGKCDRGQPRCGWCTANDKACEYKERKKPGLRAGYGRDLERRLFAVEDLLEKHSRMLDELTSSPARSAAAGPPSAVAHEVASFRSTPQMQGAYSTTYSDSPRVSHPGGPLFPGNGHGDRPYNLAAMSPTFPAPIAAPLSASTSSPALHSQELPPYDLLYSLVDLYFSNVNTWCPILERRTTLNSLFGSSAQDEADRVLLHAIVAVSMRFSNDARLTEASRKDYHESAKQKVLIYGLENSSIKSLQALVILALDFVGSSNKGAGLNLIALIVRSAVQLGLATEPFSPSEVPDYPSISTLRANNLPEAESWIEDESRRRLFWMIYVLDRDATVATAFEFALDENDIDRKLPCREDLFAKNQPVETRWFQTPKREDYSMNKPQNLGAFSYLLELKHVLSSIHTFLKRPVDISALADVERWQLRYRELDSTLRAWQSRLPNEFALNRLSMAESQRPPMLPGWILLQITYYTTLIRLHSSAAYPPHRSPIFSPSYAASQQCFSSVENIVALAHYVVHHRMVACLGPPFAFSLWVAARVLLVHGSTIEKHVSQDIHFLVDTLQDIGRHWAIAARYGAILQRVISEYQLPEAEKTTPSSVTILADMRRCAYDLDTLINGQLRQPIASSAAPFQRSAVGNELEYLEAFDFFNYPRLTPGNGMLDPNLGVQRIDANSFNISGFAADASSDWLAGNFA